MSQLGQTSKNPSRRTEADLSPTSTPPSASRPVVESATLRRRPGNLEGAFPLLLMGSVLLVYAAILANSELASKSSHLPLFGLVGGVGVVILGAGIYSTFLAPDTPPASSANEGWATIPKTGREAPPASLPKVVSPPSTLRVPPVVARPFPSRRAASRPIWEEDWDVDSEGFRAAAAPPVSADLVLRQIDEIEDALRKKRINPPSD
jgi:hypothetical protein